MSCDRYPVAVRAVGLTQCGKQKSYMLAVSWSDQNNLLIYRTFEDFRRFHKQLKRKFPTESGSVRKIPRFKDASVKQRKSGKPNRCLEVLRELETYSQKLLKTAAQVSQGEEVSQFFKACAQDLDPSFPEDSLVIMPSERGGGKKGQGWRQLPPITAPQATQSYRCIETFETKDTKNQTFQVTREEILEVLMKDRSGWWLVENADKQLAWFPASYLEELDVHKDMQHALASKEEGSLHFVVQAYECQKADELSLSSGVLVQVLRTSDNGWWLVRYKGCTGYVPCVCLKPYRNPHHQLQSSLSWGLNAPPSPCSSLLAPQPQGQAEGHPRVQPCSSLAQTEEELSSQRGRSRSLPRASSTPELELELDSLSLSSGSKEQDKLLSRQPSLSRSLPEVEQGRSSARGQGRAPHSKSPPVPRLSARDRNDSGFVEPSAADLSSSRAGPDLPACVPKVPACVPKVPACVPKVPARPSAHEILQRCSTVTRRALQHCASPPRPALDGH